MAYTLIFFLLSLGFSFFSPICSLLLTAPCHSLICLQASVRAYPWWLSSWRGVLMSSPSYWSTSETHLQSLWWFVMAVAEPRTSWPLDTNTLRREGKLLYVHVLFSSKDNQHPTGRFSGIFIVKLLHLSCCFVMFDILLSLTWRNTSQRTQRSQATVVTLFYLDFSNPLIPQIIDFFQHHQWISERPVAGDHSEDVHLQPHAGPAPLHHSYGVHEKERVGRYLCAYLHGQHGLFVDRCRKTKYLQFMLKLLYTKVLFLPPDICLRLLALL